MNIRGFYNKHIGKNNDYQASNSLVNKARREGLSKPLVGAGIGAAVGGTAGFLAGLHNLSNDEVTISTRAEHLTRPVLVGADYDPAHSYTTTYTDADGNLQTQWHHDPADWDPIIQNQRTGDVVHRQVVDKSWFGPISGTLIGLGVGAVAGALVTSLTDMVKDDVPGYWETPKKPESKEKQELAQRADKAPLIGTAVGAVVGAGAGALAGHISAGKNVAITQTVAEPVYENRTIGHIPRVSQKSSIPGHYFHPGQKIYYNEMRGEYGETPFSGSGQAINRKYFTGRYEDTTTTKNSHWLTPASGLLLGAGVGAMTGLATGVATGILMKMASGEDPPRRWSPLSRAE